MSWLIIGTLLVVGGALSTDVKEGVKDEKIVYKCVLYNSDKGLILKDTKFPLYTCETEEGDKILVAGKDLVDDKLDAILDKETYLKLKQSFLLRQPKRRGGYGGGGGGSFASAQAGSFGGGYGGGGGPGGFGGGGSFANANSGSFGGGGGNGLFWG